MQYNPGSSTVKMDDFAKVHIVRAPIVVYHAKALKQCVPVLTFGI